MSLSKALLMIRLLTLRNLQFANIDLVKVFIGVSFDEWFHEIKMLMSNCDE